MTRSIQSRRLPFLRFVFASCLALSVSGCESIFGSETDPPLPGERISVLQLQRELAPAADLAGQPVVLPEAWQNQLWPQAGGYPNHAMGHVALGQNIKQVWNVSVGQGGNRRMPLTSAPVVADGAVFVLDTGGTVTALDLGTGKTKWRQSIVPKGEEDSGAVGGGLAYADGRIFATSGYKYFYALNPQNGAHLWRAAIPAPARSAPAVLGDRVYLITLDNRLMVHSVADGSPLWRYDGVSETTNMLGSAGVAADDTLVVLPLSSGEISGLDPVTGKIIWQDNLSAVRRMGALSSISDIRGLPVIDGNAVYAVSFSGRMAALDRVTGDRLWQREIGSAEMPWIAGDTIFSVTAEQQLTALNKADGAVRWVAQLDRLHDKDKGEPIVWAGPVLAGNRLFMVSTAGRMIEADPQNGKILKTYKLDGGAMSAPVVAGNTLLVQTMDGELTAYR